jgi:hypothetical protein
MESGVEHQEVPKEHAAVKAVGGLRKQHEGWNLAAECQHKPEERTQGNCGSQKKLASSGREMTHRAGVAWRKVHVFRKNRTRETKL